MLPVTRANLDHICSTCLVDIRPSTFTRKVYDVKEEKGLSNILKLSAHITVLKNPINQSYIQEYCRKICEICFLKSQYSHFHREKIVASTITVKEVLENDEIGEKDIDRLQTFCRICLHRQHSTKGHTLTMEHLKWIKDCTGIRFTSLIETERFRLKEGTNITELLLINDAQFPKQLCPNCLKKLRNMEEFRKLATQSFEYMISVMADGEKSPTVNIRNVANEMKQEAQMVQKDLNKPVEEQNIHKVEECLQNVPDEPIESQNAIENELCLQNGIKIEEEEFTCAELKYSESDNEYDQLFDVRADYSDDDNDSFVKKEQPYSPSSPSESQDHKNKNSLDIDPIGKDEEHLTLRIKLDGKTKSAINNNKNKRKHSADVQDENESISFLGESKDHVKLSPKQSTIKNTNGNKKKRSKKLKQEDDQNNSNENESKDEIKLIPETNEKTNPTKRTRKAKQFKCEECGAAFFTQKLLDSHMRKHKGMDQPFDCDKCAKTFCSIYILRRHKKEMHRPKEEENGEEEASNTCSYCSQTFKRKHHLNDHIKAVHEKLKPFKCSYCDKCFSTRSIKRVHEFSHTDTFPFVCDWCAKRFRRSSQLKIHLEIHTTQPEFLCPICKRAQKTAKSLEDHLKIHDEKRLQCPSCGKLFRNNTHLRDHQNAVHLKLRPFKCEFCDLAFGDRKTRRVHEKSHTEDRPEICPICKRGFKSRNTLGRHMKEFGHLTEDFIKNNKKGKKKSQVTHLENVANVHRDIGLNYLVNEFSD